MVYYTLFVAHGAVVATFTILSLFAYLFCLYYPYTYIFLITLEIFFVYYEQSDVNTANEVIFPPSHAIIPLATALLIIYAVLPPTINMHGTYISIKVNT